MPHDGWEELRMKAAARWVVLLIGLLSLLGGPGGRAPQAFAAEQDQICFQCHNVGDFDVAGYQASAHAPFGCTQCHFGYQFGAADGSAAQVPSALQETAQHLKVKSPGEALALAACSRCHPKEFSDVRQSAHGQVIFEKGRSDGAFCLDCHGSPHTIRKAADPSKEYSKQAIASMCERCHRNPKIVDEYRLNPAVASTYEDSMHGKLALLGRTDIPSCADCHQAHLILARADANSTVAAAHLSETCGKCHSGATLSFAGSFEHRPFTRTAFPIAYYLNLFYAMVTLGTIFALVFHVFLDAQAEMMRGKRGPE